MAATLGQCGHLIFQIYIKINAEAELDDDIKVKAREYFHKLENGKYIKVLKVFKSGTLLTHAKTMLPKLICGLKTVLRA